jgi:predicted dehydrogenase
MSTLRGALIGVGNIAVKGHLPAYVQSEKLREEVEIVAVADPSPTNCAKAQELVPRVHTYTAVGDLLRKEELDFVDICAPPHSRSEIIEEALEYGCHILCEKPLARSVAEGRAIAERVRSKKAIFVPCHQYRYSRVWRTVKELIEREELGKLLLAQFSIFRMEADSGTPDWQSNWRVDPKISGGGILVDTGSHYFYLLSYLFGKPQRFTALTATLRHHEYPVEDTALVIAEYDDFVVQINLTWAADRRENRNSITGEKGNLFTGGDRILLNQNGVQREFPGEDVSNKATYVGWYAQLLTEFCNRIKARNDSPDLLEEALNVLVWTQCCYESAAKRMTVTVK